MTDIRLRPPHPDEAPALSRLMHRSKAHWGYDEDFMKICEATLFIAPEKIGRDFILVAVDVDTDDTPLGVGSVTVKGAQSKLDKLFIAPEAMGLGVGRLLFDAMADEARRKGAKSLHILSDPGAASFYERMGAVKTGDAPSNAIPGRTLPVLDFAL